MWLSCQSIGQWFETYHDMSWLSAVEAKFSQLKTDQKTHVVLNRDTTLVAPLFLLFLQCG